MNETLALTVAGWTWVLAGIGLLTAVVYITFSEEPDEPLQHLVVMAGAVSGTGSLVLALHFLGFLTAALWAWRAASVPYVLMSMVLFQKSAPSTTIQSISAVPPPRWTWARTTAVANLVMAVFLGTISTIARSVLRVSGSTMLRVPATMTVITIEGIRLWHGLALGILATGTALFLILFIRMVERGVTPQLESHWGGIGGGMSGWRLSASLTYLLAAAVFGVLFAVFVIQLDVNPAAPPAKPQTTTAPNR